jgi:hypothetical protein
VCNGESPKTQQTTVDLSSTFNLNGTGQANYIFGDFKPNSCFFLSEDNDAFQLLPEYVETAATAHDRYDQMTRITDTTLNEQRCITAERWQTYIGRLLHLRKQKPLFYLGQEKHQFLGTEFTRDTAHCKCSKRADRTWFNVTELDLHYLSIHY